MAGLLETSAQMGTAYFWKPNNLTAGVPRISVQLERIFPPIVVEKISDIKPSRDSFKTVVIKWVPKLISYDP